MNDPEFHDLDLQSFESRLGAIPLRLAPDQQQHMLYECAFAAGQQQVRRTVRAWQATTIVMGVILAFVAMPRKPDDFMAQHTETTPAIAVEKLLPEPPQSEEVSFVSWRSGVSVNLDAWQLPASTSNVWGQPLAQSNSSDHPNDAFTMGEMLRSQSF